MVSASNPPQLIGVDGSSPTSPPCDGSMSRKLMQKFASVVAYWRFACFLWSIGLGGLTVRQNESKSFDQLKKSDRESMHSAMDVTWATVSFVLPLPFWAHCWLHQPGVRGQFSPAQMIGVTIESSSRTVLWPLLPTHSPVAETSFWHCTVVGHSPPPAATSAVTSKVMTSWAPGASEAKRHSTLPPAEPTAGAENGAGLETPVHTA